MADYYYLSDPLFLRLSILYNPFNTVDMTAWLFAHFRNQPAHGLRQSVHLIRLAPLFKMTHIN